MTHQLCYTTEAGRAIVYDDQRNVLMLRNSMIESRNKGREIHIEPDDLIGLGLKLVSIGHFLNTREVEHA